METGSERDRDRQAREGELPSGAGEDAEAPGGEDIYGADGDAGPDALPGAVGIVGGVGTSVGLGGRDHSDEDTEIEAEREQAAEGS